jgi:hypothetical protein
MDPKDRPYRAPAPCLLKTANNPKGPTQVFDGERR